MTEIHFFIPHHAAQYIHILEILKGELHISSLLLIIQSLYIIPFWKDGRYYNRIFSRAIWMIEIKLHGTLKFKMDKLLQAFSGITTVFGGLMYSYY